jgi:hypothetical protein
MVGYKHPTIHSGATPIRSVERAPDKKENLLKKGLYTKVIILRRAPESNKSSGAESTLSLCSATST